VKKKTRKEKYKKRGKKNERNEKTEVKKVEERKKRENERQEVTYCVGCQWVGKRYDPSLPVCTLPIDSVLLG
jgi:hypothetical protein